MRAEETITEAEMNYRVSIEGLPDFFVSAKNPGEVKIKMRKMLKKPDMLNKVMRVPDGAMKKHFRLKAQGKDEDEQQPMKEETVMSEDNTNPLVKAVSDILSRNSFNSFRDVKPIDEKMSSKEKIPLEVLRLCADLEIGICLDFLDTTNAFSNLAPAGVCRDGTDFD